MALSPGTQDTGTPDTGTPDTRATARLGCGRTIESVWERIDQSPDGHERGCADCQAARKSLARLQTATDEMRRSSPEVPSRGVKDAVMSVARAEVRRGRKLSIRTTGSGTIQISEQIVAGLVRDVADEFPGVYARRCTVALDQPPAATGGADRSGQTLAEEGVREVDVTLGVAVALGAPIPAVLSELRQRVRERVEGRLGVVTARIDVTVEDVFDAAAGLDTGLRELGAAS